MIVNSKDERDGIGRRLPGATEFVERLLGESVSSRLLSALEHGHSQADATPALHAGEAPPHGSRNRLAIVTVAKSSDADDFGWLVDRAATGYAMPARFRARLPGTGQERSAGYLERAFAAPRIGDSAERPWWTVRFTT